MYHLDRIKGALFGLAIGDAIGVPVEFTPRDKLIKKPVTGMTGYGTYNQPAGTFSDDSSLSFCLAETIIEGFSVDTLASKMLRWKNEAYWSATGEVFDIGIATSNALARLESGITPDLSGGFEEPDNGNGSLMRILPLIFYILNSDQEKRFSFAKQVSSITHMHIRSVIACFYYLELALKLLQGQDKRQAYATTGKEVEAFLFSMEISANEIDLFRVLLREDIATYPVEQIASSGYVIDTLISAVWSFMKTDSYQATVLTAVNLGHDTDTVGSVAGGLAGLYYGYSAIPNDWIRQIKKRVEIEELSIRLSGVTS